MTMPNWKTSKVTHLALAGLASLGLTIALSSPAEAVWIRGECSTTGAHGWIDADWYGADNRIDFLMNYEDTLADGHYISARLVTEDHSGKVKYWPWHSDKNGANNGYEFYNSYAINSSGIFDWGIQVARFDGSTLLNSCTDWAIGR